jgi:hypothetical protein
VLGRFARLAVVVALVGGGLAVLGGTARAAPEGSPAATARSPRSNAPEAAEADAWADVDLACEAVSTGDLRLLLELARRRLDGPWPWEEGSPGPRGPLAARGAPAERPLRAPIGPLFAGDAGAGAADGGAEADLDRLARLASGADGTPGVGAPPGAPSLDHVAEQLAAQQAAAKPRPKLARLAEIALVAAALLSLTQVRRARAWRRRARRLEPAPGPAPAPAPAPEPA